MSARSLSRLSLALALVGAASLTAAPRARADEPSAPAGAPPERGSDAAASEGAPLSFEALEAMLDESPRLRAARLAADAGEGDVTTAGTPENPVLSFDFMGLLSGEPTSGDTTSNLGLSQTLPWPGQLDARVRAARARLAADRSLVDVVRAYARLDLLRAYVALVAAQDREGSLGEAERHLAAVAEVVRARATAGAGRRWDAVRVDAELAALRATRDGAHADVLAAGGRITALLGRPDLHPRASETLGTLAHTRVPRDASTHPRLLAARRETEAAEAALSAERAWVVPPIDLRIGTAVSTGPLGGYLVGGFSFPLPIFDRNQGAIERAEATARAAHEAEDASLAEITAAQRAAERALATREAALARFDEGVTSSLGSIGDMAETAFRGGEIDVFELLDAVRATRELRLERIEREESVRQAEIDLVEATAP